VHVGDGGRRCPIGWSVADDRSPFDDDGRPRPDGTTRHCGPVDQLTGDDPSRSDRSPREHDHHDRADRDDRAAGADHDDHDPATADDDAAAAPEPVRGADPAG
jgi:hypothetical protein